MAWHSTPSTVGYLELEPAVPERLALPEEEVGVYVHIPFCRYLCTYCDFDTFVGQERMIDSYVNAVVEQIDRSPVSKGKSLYLGGGTPSILTPEQAARIVAACRNRTEIPDSAEIAMEANPSGLEAGKMEGFRQAGFNRLSIGVQSTDKGLLRLLGRRHTAEDARNTVEAARAAGFGDISLDLIYGVPKQDLATWETTLKTVVEWGIDHLSCYMLTVEPGTPMEKGVSRGTLVVPEDEETVAMYELAAELLAGAGYERYEISNFARPGHRSRHNLVYWRNRPYLGIGAGAAGYWRGRRYKLLPDIVQYVRGVRAGLIPLSEDEQPDSRRALSDGLILGLRLTEGVDVRDLEARFGTAPYAAFGDALNWAESNGLLEKDGDRLRLTWQGVLLSNELFERLL